MTETDIHPNESEHGGNRKQPDGNPIEVKDEKKLPFGKMIIDLVLWCMLAYHNPRKVN